MRIVHVAPRFPPAEGGGERHVARLTAELAKRGHVVTVLTTKLLSEVPQRWDVGLPDEEAVQGVRVRRLAAKGTGLPLWGYGFDIPGLPEAIEAARPDVVHLHGYGYRTNDRVADRKRDASPPVPWALVLTSHGFVPGRGVWGPVKKAYDATLGTRTVGALDAAIAIAPPDAATFHELGARRVEVVPNGVEFERFASATPDTGLLRKLRLREGQYVLSVARLEPIKGQDVLLEAFAAAGKELEGLDLVLAGEGTQEMALREKAAALGVADRVRLPGRLGDKEVASLARSARAFAHTPREEPFGIVVLEAMAAGLPVLAVEVGGLPYACADAALLVKPEPGAIAEGLARVTRDDALRARLVAAGRAHARAWSWEANAARVEAVYRDAVAGVAGPAAR